MTDPHQSASNPAPAELPKAYVPAEHEPRIRERWDTSGAFHADPKRVLDGHAKPYSIFIPPPNVTGALHLGHALNNTLQDILTRAHRMQGYEALWMPGTDHAGIATQFVVERRLRQEGKLKGPLKAAMTREQFIDQVQLWKDEYERRITDQLKAMGASCDFARQRFTMDDICARAVHEAFFRLFKDGLIYRGKRLVNWDPALQTAVADDECYDEEIDGQFYYLRYPLVHPHGSPTAKERRHGHTGGDDAVPVTWSELRARGWPAQEDAEHADEIPAWVTVATTRPETYLGDTAVAINPKDPRAKALRGLTVELPLIGRVIPIIEDDYVVLPAALAADADAPADPKAAFATGFLKVTPAHDANDYALGERHNLPKINIFAPDATVSAKHGWDDPRELQGGHVFLGLKRDDARKKVIEEFKAKTVGGEPGAPHLFAASKPYRHSVPHSDRSKAVIEPYLTDQWYVRVTDPRLAQAANNALVPDQRTAPGASTPATVATPSDPARLRFHPARYAKTYETWHDNIRDWCISRQLWWGHQIPVWTKAGWTRVQEAAFVATIDHAIRSGDAAWSGHGDTTHVCLRDPHDRPLADLLERHGFTRDPDVLDTWFSSALWPLSTLGWPDPDQSPQTKGLLDAFNPSSVLSTAREIITLWVSRMVMFNRYLHGQGQGQGPIPFHDVFIHAVVQDGHGKRMSKSAGNGVDPLDIINSHGADALRFTLCQMTTQTQDVRLPVQKDPKTGQNTSPKFDLGRNFCNKLWNAARYAITIGSDPAATRWLERDAFTNVNSAPLTLPDRWLLSRLAHATDEITRAIRNYEFADYATIAYDLVWRDFCDWYLEAIKPTVTGHPAQCATLLAALRTILRLLHPVIPFVTETIWERLKDLPANPIMGLTLAPPRTGHLLCTAPWPQIDPALRDPLAEREFANIQALVTAVRELRAQHNVKPSRKITLHLPTALAPKDSASSLLIATLAGLGTISHVPPQGPAVAFSFNTHTAHITDLADAVDAATERARLEKDLADKDKSIQTLEARLANPGYADRAPPAMVQQTRDQLAKAKADRTALASALAGLA